MKKTRLLFLITALVFAVLGTIAAHAALSATANLAGPDAVRENGSFTVDFKVSCDEIYGMEAKLTETGPITRKNITLNSELDGWTVENLNGVFMVYSNDLAKSFSGQNVTLFSITYELTDAAKIGDTVSVKFSDTVLANHLTSDQTDPFTVSYTKTVQKKVSTNTNLLSLKIDGKALDEFDYTKTEYQISVPFETKAVDISAVCAGEGATYSVSGNNDLKVGANNVVIKVTAASGDTKNYTVKVIRDNPPDLARLSGLKAEGYTLSPAFDPEIFEYTVSVPYTKQSITLTPTGSSSVSFSVDGGSKLKVGENTVTIKVTDTHGNTKDYTVTVVRRQNSNTNLLKLSVAGYTLSPAFDYTVTKYTLTVNSSETALDLNTIAAGDGATVAVTGNELDQNGGVVVITVTAMDGSTKDYTITVTKNGALPPDDNEIPPATGASKLTSLSVSNFTLTPGFSASVTAYALTVPNNITSLQITAIGENGSEVIINGADALKIGANRVTVVVKADGKTDTEYVINVTREEAEPAPEKAKLNSITLSSGTLSPIFSPDVFSYIVYLPFETATLTVSATGNEEATIDGTGEYTLSPGSNTITLTASTADGNATYTIIAYVMPAYDGTLPNLNNSNTQTNSSVLSVVGSNTVGGKLTAHFEGISQYSVRWFRDGNTVGGSLDYIVTAADMGKTLTVSIYDAEGNMIATHDVSISAATASLGNKSSGFDTVGMVISLIAALATLVIGFIVGKTLKRNR